MAKTPQFMRADTVYSNEFYGFGNGQACIMGIDEAGRGPVLGPMVYACAVTPLSEQHNLERLGVADSKQLSERKRDKIFELIGNTETIAYAFQQLSAKYISAHMLSAVKKKNLNEISQNAAAKLIQCALDSKINVTAVYVDTVGPPVKYQEFLQRKFPGIKVTVTEKADAELPIVSAASIVAKVTRDATFKEFDKEILKSSRKRIGSGYPGDPDTKDYMCRELDPVFGYTDFVRFPWKPAENAMKEGCVECKLNNADAQPTILDFFTRKSEPVAQVKSTFFKKRKVKHLTKF